jgi:hypothetical protein
MYLYKEWILAAAICIVPFLLFGAAEVAGIVQKRRFQAVARRSKSRPAERRSRVGRSSSVDRRI